ncbi:MAG: hypothetical protein JWM12_91 [Ilumatobacteraceae bacterium]|jgi:uncharacterized protein involved in type VI secretion and phage assembly|nr:hypothetical protein [Ilumatobacteraceae bacterium]
MSGAHRGVRPLADELSGPESGWPGVHVAIVTDNQDPDQQGRVKVRLPWAPDSGSARYETWARVATMMAGATRGTFFVPDPDDEVLVAFAGGDPRQPIVIGSMWNGSDRPAEEMAIGNRKRTILTGAGVRITLDDTPGAISLLLETPGGQRVKLNDSPATVLLEDSGGNSLKLEPGGVTVVSAKKVSVKAATVEVEAGMVTVKSAASTFTGMVKCDALITNSVVSAAYSPGAGNIW